MMNNTTTFETKRWFQIKKLFLSSTPAEQKRIKAGLKAGRLLRRQVEQYERVIR